MSQSVDIDGEYRRELLQSLHDRTTPVLEIAAGVAIEATEIGAANTARDDVVPGSGVEGDEGGAGLCHAGLLPWNRDCRKATAVAAGVQGKWVSRRARRNHLSWSDPDGWFGVGAASGRDGRLGGSRPEVSLQWAGARPRSLMPPSQRRFPSPRTATCCGAPVPVPVIRCRSGPRRVSGAILGPKTGQ